MDTRSDPSAPARADGPDDVSPSAPPRPRVSAALRVLLAMLMLPPAAFAGSLLMLVPGYGRLLQLEDAVAVLAYAPFAALVLAAYVLLSWVLVRGVDRLPFRALGLRIDARALLALVTGCAIALVLGLAGAGIAEVSGMGRRVEAPAAEQPMLPLAAVLALVLLRAFVLQGIGEEVLFRGYLLQSLRRRPVLGVVIAAGAFAVPHLASNGGQQGLAERLLYLAIPFGFALSAGFLAVAMRSVWGAVGIHGGFHVASTAVSLLGLTADGPAIWVLLGALHALAGVLLALRIPRRRWEEVREHGPYARDAVPRPAA